MESIDAKCIHEWDGCKCIKCNQIRNEGHDWKKKSISLGAMSVPVCSRCGRQRKNSGNMYANPTILAYGVGLSIILCILFYSTGNSEIGRVLLIVFLISLPICLLWFYVLKKIDEYRYKKGK